MQVQFHLLCKAINKSTSTGATVTLWHWYQEFSHSFCSYPVVTTSTYVLCIRINKVHQTLLKLNNIAHDIHSPENTQKNQSES